MDQPSTALLAGWANFYVIVGSSAGALAGLQFVVMTLMVQRQAAATEREIRAFGTPTVVHFCVALLLASMMSAPWHSLAPISFGEFAGGAFGLTYSSSIVWHARKTRYTPDAEDWLWYAAVPILSYSAMLSAAILLWRAPVVSLFITAGTSLVFLLTGIRNSWDTVTYVALHHGPARAENAGQDDRN